MTNLNVVFLSFGNIYNASHRMRALKPSELLNKFTKGKVSSIVTSTLPTETDKTVFVFGKHFNKENVLPLLMQIKQAGHPTVFDVCDDHFDRVNGDFYKSMLLECTVVVCNTEAMQKRIKEVTGRDSFVIQDPKMFSKGHFKDFSTQRILWHGHSTNAIALRDWLDVIKVPDGSVTVICDALVNHPKITSVLWKPQIVDRRLLESNIVLLPVVPKEWSKYKSPNRVVDAIMSGNFVITNGTELYEEFKDFVYLVSNPEDVNKALEFVKENPEEVSKRILKGQEYILKTYTDQKILDGWLEVLKSLGQIKSYE